MLASFYLPLGTIYYTGLSSQREPQRRILPQEIQSTGEKARCNLPNLIFRLMKWKHLQLFRLNLQLLRARQSNPPPRNPIHRWKSKIYLQLISNANLQERILTNSNAVTISAEALPCESDLQYGLIPADELHSSDSENSTDYEHAPAVPFLTDKKYQRKGKLILLTISEIFYVYD